MNDETGIKNQSLPVFESYLDILRPHMQPTGR